MAEVQNEVLLSRKKWPSVWAPAYHHCCQVNLFVLVFFVTDVLEALEVFFVEFSWYYYYYDDDDDDEGNDDDDDVKSGLTKFHHSVIEFIFEKRFKKLF